MDQFSFIGNSEIQSIDRLYRQYLENPDSVDESWRNFFRGFDFARQYYTENQAGNEHLDKEFKVLNYIDAFRKRGHLFPSRQCRRSQTQLGTCADHRVHSNRR